jgi:ATP-binding cassette subfamily C (CFTR/MRP) protein 1
MKADTAEAVAFSHHFLPFVLVWLLAWVGCIILTEVSVVFLLVDEAMANCGNIVANTSLWDLDLCFENTYLSPIPFLLFVVFGPLHIWYWWPFSTDEPPSRSSVRQSSLYKVRKSLSHATSNLFDENENGKRDESGASYALLESESLVEAVSSAQQNVETLPATGEVDKIRQKMFLLGIVVPFIGIVVSILDPVVAPPAWHEWLYVIASSLTALAGFIMLSLDIAWKVSSITSLSVIWLFSFLFQSLACYTRVNLTLANGILPMDISVFVNCFVFFAIFLAVILVKDERRQYFIPTINQAKPCPEVNEGFFSVLYFNWINPIVDLGYIRALKHTDLYNLHPLERAEELDRKLQKCWAEEISESDPSFARALRRAFGYTWYVGMLMKLVYDSLLFVGPIYLNLTIEWLSSQYTMTPEPLSQGIFYSFLVLAASIVQSVMLHQYFHRAYRTGMRLKSATISLIFKKSLRIKPGTTVHARNSGSNNATGGNAKPENQTNQNQPKPATPGINGSGSIVNLMSVDTQRLQDLMIYVATLVSGPYQITLSMYLLWLQLGVSVLAGLAVMLIMIPITGRVTSYMKQEQAVLMKKKDLRIKNINEILSGIIILKMYAWERSFLQKLEGIREDELAYLRRYALVNCFARALWTVVPVFVSVASFGVFVALGNNLTPSIAFTSIALFNILRFPVAYFPQLVTSTLEAQISCQRIQAFLQLPEVAPLPKVVPGDCSVVCRDAFLAWEDEQQTPLLSHVTVTCHPGRLTAIIGSTGSGKSGLFSALIGDLRPVSGSISVNGSIAFSSQVAWIRNGSLRENILFGNAYNPVWYEEVIFACALKADLAMLSAGDKTEIGERGINLSGGQKQRVALARAVYADAAVYLLDDPLSAVDSHVALHIFEHCIRGLLRRKTVLLATHNLRLLPQVDQIMLLENGRCSFVGTFQEFRNTGHVFATEAEAVGFEDIQIESKLDQTLLRKVTSSRSITNLPKAPSNHKLANASVTSTFQNHSVAVAQSHFGDAALFQTESQVLYVPIECSFQDMQESAAAANIVLAKSTVPVQRLIEDEDIRVGQVDPEVYSHYFASSGSGLFWSAFFLCVLAQAFTLGSNSWLSYWSDYPDKVDGNLGVLVYSLLGCGAAVATYTASVLFTLASLKASKVLHSEMATCLMRAPMSFFDTTPLGRIVNRFTKDMYIVDEQLMNAIYTWLTTLLTVIAMVGVITYITPMFAVAMIPPFMLYYITLLYYVPTSRQLQRLDSVSRSPVFSHFSETLEGSAIIRAFRAQTQFIQQIEKRVDHNLEAYYLYVASFRWLATRLEFVGSLTVFCAMLFAIIYKSPAGLGGLSITYALSNTQTLNWMVRTTAEREGAIVSAERVMEYSKVPPEAPANIPERQPRVSWPEQGAIVFQDLNLRYRAGLDLVLKNLCLSIGAAEKVGIVGRTGAGKSSLLKALLRLVEPSDGSLVIDGIDVLHIGLEDLRSRLSIIPQDPVLFADSVRFNLDPFNTFTDDIVWQALRRSHLESYIRTLPGELAYVVEEGGRNFSMGQRQLLCLARALLRHSTILLLDEATSAVCVTAPVF